MQKKTVFFISLLLSNSLFATYKLSDEIILNKGTDEYMEVRHITINGTNEEIGYVLGEIAKTNYGIKKLNQYADSSYAKARLEYMKINDPILLDKMKGIAQAYNISLTDTLFDTSYLTSLNIMPQCSGVVIPSSYSENGHTFYAANRDYYLATFSEIIGEKPKQGEKKIFSDIAIIETYPNKGYSSLMITVAGPTGSIDIINSQGLAVAVYQDDSYGFNRTKKDASKISGLLIPQVMMLIANTCATLDEAKQVLLNNKISMLLFPMHIQIIEKSGNSFIYEVSSEDYSEHFVYNNGKPQVITNHSVYANPDISNIPISTNPYDSFNRYRRLTQFVNAHKDKFVLTEGWQAIDLVVGAVQEATELKDTKIPLRTFYQILVDNEEKSMKIRFYLKDRSVESKSKYAQLIFSKAFDFKLHP